VERTDAEVSLARAPIRQQAPHDRILMVNFGSEVTGLIAAAGARGEALLRDR